MVSGRAPSMIWVADRAEDVDGRPTPTMMALLADVAVTVYDPALTVTSTSDYQL